MTEQRFLPVASVRSVGTDPEPYYFPETGHRSALPSFIQTCWLAPREDRVHVPTAPSDLFCGFREAWESPEVNGAHDLAEFAEMRLAETPADGTRENRLFRRFLGLCAAVLPRPYAAFEERWSLSHLVS